MKYEGKLYGKFAGKYIDTGKTSKDWDDLEKDVYDRASRIIEIAEELEKMKQSRDSWEEMHQTAMAEWLKSVNKILELKENLELKSNYIKQAYDAWAEENAEKLKLKKALESIANTNGERWLQPFEMRDIANKALELTTQPKSFPSRPQS